jgi:hypothetical protein
MLPQIHLKQEKKKKEKTKSLEKTNAAESRRKCQRN